MRTADARCRNLNTNKQKQHSVWLCHHCYQGRWCCSVSLYVFDTAHIRYRFLSYFDDFFHFFVYYWNDLSLTHPSIIRLVWIAHTHLLSQPLIQERSHSPTHVPCCAHSQYSDQQNAQCYCLDFYIIMSHKYSYMFRSPRDHRQGTNQSDTA
jgi:hypothetical protein